MIPEADYYVTRLNQLQNLADNYQHLADDHRRLANERAGEIDELRRQLAECRQQRDRLRTAVEAVEWVFDPTQPEPNIEDEDLENYLCPWCGETADVGHSVNCQRQQALGGEGNR